MSRRPCKFVNRSGQCRAAVFAEQMYVLKKGTPLLAWDIWVRPTLANQKERSGQEQEHTLAVLCFPETPMTASAMFALMLIDLKAILGDAKLWH